jgi:hypothetical protein
MATNYTNHYRRHNPNFIGAAEAIDFSYVNGDSETFETNNESEEDSEDERFQVRSCYS